MQTNTPRATSQAASRGAATPLGTSNIRLRLIARFWHIAANLLCLSALLGHSTCTQEQGLCSEKQGAGTSPTPQLGGAGGEAAPAAPTVISVPCNFTHSLAELQHATGGVLQTGNLCAENHGAYSVKHIYHHDVFIYST